MEGVMASAVDEYLEMYDTVQRLAERNVDVADYLFEISQLMRDNPRPLFDAIRSDWPTAEQMLSLIAGLLNAHDELSRRWDKLPDKFKSGLLKTPNTAG